MQRRTALLGLLVLASLPIQAGASPAAPQPAAELGKGRYSRMKMRLEKTVLKIDVLDLEIRVDQDTADALESIVKGKTYSKKLEKEIVDTVLRATDVLAGIRFLRDVTFSQYVEGGQDSARRAYDEKLISQAEYVRVRDGLARWFAPLKKRGIVKGDRFGYRGRPLGLQTLVHDAAGEKLLELSQEGPLPRHTMLASYLAPGSDFREPLVRSLFDASSKS